MSEKGSFEPPLITDDDIRWVSKVLKLPERAFYGFDGTDARQGVLKSWENMDVAACPGSGKTTLLVAKLAILAEKWQYQTRGICVLSHTNAARREIETRLGNVSAGQRLLSYPHFIGTIHRFVSEFLAAPWLRARGFPVRMIDNDVCEARRWNKIKKKYQFALQNKVVDESNIRIVDANFRVAKKNGTFPFADTTATSVNVRQACEATAKEGYHCYDDMFIWAGDLMDKVGSVVDVIRDRFPCVFIDEAQDNSEAQSALLFRIFVSGNSPVTRHRFGDENQAIFNSMQGKGANTDRFPDPAIGRDLKNSHRFGQVIADLADPLGLVPCGLKGEGPAKSFSSGAPEGSHTIFLFDSMESTSRVLDAYSELLIHTFSREELNEGSFVAVGAIHRPSDEEDSKKFPRHVGHYWPEYDPELSSQDPKPKTLLQYVWAGMDSAQMSGESFPALEKIAQGILRLAGMMNEGAKMLRPRRYSHRYVMQLLESNQEERKFYEAILMRFALERNPLTEAMWNEVLPDGNRRPDRVRRIASALAKAESPEGSGIDAFLAWPRESESEVAESGAMKRRDNIYHRSRNDKDVAIRIGSIHSVKGQTHTATLVLETFWYGHNLELLLPWLSGEKCGKESAGVRQVSRLKLHFVAMTRPTHLLCLAMKRSTLEKDEGILDENLARKLRERGWQIKEV